VTHPDDFVRMISRRAFLAIIRAIAYENIESWVLDSLGLLADKRARSMTHCLRLRRDAARRWGAVYSYGCR